MSPDEPVLSVVVEGGGPGVSEPEAEVEYVTLYHAEGSGAPRVTPALRWNEAAGRATGEVLLFTAAGSSPPQASLQALAEFFAHNAQMAALTDSGPQMALLAVRRAAFITAGGFDESLPPGAGEMESLVMKLSRDGGKVSVAEQPGALRGHKRRIGFVRRQWRLGFAGRYARHRPAHPKPTGPLLRRTLARAVRACGRATSLLVGGEPTRLTASPLLGPCSDVLVGEGGERPAVSVVLPAYGGLGCAGFALGALCRQDIEVPYEVVVVTDGESGVAEQLRRHWPRVRPAWCDPADGPGGARNRGIEAARGDYVAFTDADCIPDGDWLRRLVAACRQAKGGPVAGWMAAAYQWSPAARATNATQLGMLCPPSPCRVGGIWGANMCVGAGLLRTGGARFAEGRYGAEEMAFLHSLGDDRQPVLLEPAARVRHLRRDGFGASIRHQYRLGRGAGRTRRDFPLRGSTFARHRWLAPLLVPGRYLLLGVRVIRRNPPAILELLRLTPLVLIQLVGYAAGFRAGARQTTTKEQE